MTIELDELLLERLQRPAALETGGDVGRMVGVCVVEAVAAHEEFSLARRGVDVARKSAAVPPGGSVANPNQSMSAPSHDSGIEHPAPTSVSGGDSQNNKRKSRHHAR